MGTQGCKIIHLMNIITIFCLIITVNGEIELKIKFLTDVFEFYTNKNIKFTLFLCWSKSAIKTLRKQNMNSPIGFFTDGTTFLTNYKDDHTNLRILDLACSESFDILSKANNSLLFTAPNKWLLINLESIDYTEKFHEMAWFIDSEIIIAKGSNHEIILQQSYHYSKYYSTIEYEIFGYWTEQNRIVDTRKTHETSYRRKNLHRTPVHTSYAHYHSNTMEIINHNKFTEPNKDSLVKHCHYVHLTLMDYVNASLEWKLTSGWGHLVNGNWTGIMGNLISGVDDISGNGLLINPIRITAVKYLSRDSKTGLVFIFRKPPLSYTKNIFRLSFQKNVWISIGGLCIISSITLYVTLYWEIKHQTKEEVTDTYNVPALKLKPSEITLFLLGGLCQQGCESEPRQLTGRTVTIFLYLSLMFFYVSYSANIVVLLQSASNDIKTLEDLRYGRIKLGSLDIEYIKALKNSSIPILKALYEEKMADNFYSITDGMKKVRQDFFAFLGENGNCYFEIRKLFQESEKCHLEEIYISSKSLSATYTAVPKKSPYLETFKVGIMKMEENGIQQRFYKKFYAEKPKCDNAGANFVIVGLTEVYFAFIVWIVGVSIGVAIFLTEKLYYKCYKKGDVNLK